MVQRIYWVGQISRSVLGLKSKQKPFYLMCNFAFVINAIKYWSIINYTMIETSEHQSMCVLIVIPYAIIKQSNISCRGIAYWFDNELLCDMISSCPCQLIHVWID